MASVLTSGQDFAGNGQTCRVALESVEIVCPSCFHTFEIRRHSVEALVVGNEEENPIGMSLWAVIE